MAHALESVAGAGRPRLLLSLSDKAIEQTFHRLALRRGWSVAVSEEESHGALCLTDTISSADPGEASTWPGIVLVFSEERQPGERPDIVKLRLPVALSAVVQAIETLWQRAKVSVPHPLGTTLRYIAPERRLVGRSGHGMLTGKETELLEALIAAGDEGIGRDDLLRQVWHYADGMETHTLETHIYRLRQKIDGVAPHEILIIGQDGRYRLSALSPSEQSSSVAMTTSSA